jgi:hypothetical protein
MLEKRTKIGIAPTLLSPSSMHITYSLGISFVILDAVAMNRKQSCKAQGHAVAQLVEALRYKLEGRGFNSQWCQWNFSLT